MSIETKSWISWEVESLQSAEYDIFVVYEPENNDKSYTLSCGDQQITHVLPGVDRMLQTSYMGSLRLTKGKNSIIFDQAHRNHPLEPLGLELHKIIIRRK